MKRRRFRNMRLLHLSDVNLSSGYDIDITVEMPSPIITTNYDALLADVAANWSITTHPDTDHFIQLPHHGWPRAPRLRFCEILVALAAPKDRIDELIGDHRTELRNLVAEHGVRWGIWIRRCRLICETCRMLPTMALRIWAIWRATS
jgi:hypothetical protein